MIAFEVLEHIPQDQMADAIADVRRVLRPGGLLWISVPAWPIAFSERLIRAWMFGCWPRLNNLECWDFPHERRYVPGQLESDLQGFEVVSTHRLFKSGSALAIWKLNSVLARLRLPAVQLLWMDRLLPFDAASDWVFLAGRPDGRRRAWPDSTWTIGVELASALMAWFRQRSVQRALVWLAAVAVPAATTIILVRFGGHQQRDYVFVYLAVVAVIGLLGGLGPAILSAVLSFLLVDYFFVPPIGSFTITDEEDIVNLLAFAATAGVVGWLASRRRSVLIAGEALGRQLREANTELVRLNKEQAAAAQAALRVARSEQQVRALQETDRLRRDLLANVSHELRTPLGTILTESTDTDGLDLSGDARRRLETIAAEARRLNALVDDMLDMARIESGALELELEPILLADAVQAAVDRLHNRSPQREVKMAGRSAGVEVLADWDRLGQILDNLLVNADRFSPPARRITVEISRQQPGLVTIRVIDQGPGIAPELREHAFDRFVRSAANPDGTTSAGSGLGLSIVKGLVEAHAGTVEVEAPTEGVGAVLRFTLPEASGQVA